LSTAYQLSSDIGRRLLSFCDLSCFKGSTYGAMLLIDSAIIQQGQKNPIDPISNKLVSSDYIK
jgi:hypothetical protein